MCCDCCFVETANVLSSDMDDNDVFFPFCPFLYMCTHFILILLSFLSSVFSLHFDDVVHKVQVCQHVHNISV